MATNDFLPFATGGTANVVTQAAYLADPVVGTGFQSGVAPSAKFNKALRQSSIISAMVAQFIADNQAANVVDDGTIATIEANFKIALNAAGITAAQFDNTTKAATTAFVQRALGNLSGFTSLGAASGTITAAQAGQLIGYGVASAGTYALPNPSGNAGLAFWIENFSNFNLTLTLPSGNFVGYTNSFVVAPATNVIVVLDGANAVLIGGNGAASFAGTGYQKLPSGILIQWLPFNTGAGYAANSAYAFTWPITFNTFFACAVANSNGGSLNDYSSYNIVPTTSGGNIYSANAGQHGGYIIGVGK